MRKNVNQQEYETIAREYGRVSIQDMFTNKNAIARYYSKIFNVKLSSIRRVLTTIQEHKEKKNTAILDDKG